jgi:DNA excision repair protein ERCC-1
MDNITVPTSPANGSMLPPNGFQPASAILKASSANSSTGTLRNASGGLPPIPKNRPAVEQTKEKAEEATSASVAKAKPINRPVASKNAIVYNAVQVSHVCHN